jgi:hypothetical protein
LFLDSIVSTKWDGKARNLAAVICEKCGEKFYARKDSGVRYCSRKCACAARTAACAVPLVCWMCKANFTRQRGHVSKATHGIHFCSRHCKDNAQSIKGGCGEIRPAHYGNGSSVYRDSLKDTCEGCGESRRFLLIVHHVDGDRQNNAEGNLETVCFNCHGIRHLRNTGSAWVIDFSALTPREALEQFYGTRSRVVQAAGCEPANESSILSGSPKIDVAQPGRAALS